MSIKMTEYTSLDVLLESKRNTRNNGSSIHRFYLQYDDIPGLVDGRCLYQASFGAPKVHPKSNWAPLPHFLTSGVQKGFKIGIEQVHTCEMHFKFKRSPL